MNDKQDYSDLSTWGDAELVPSYFDDDDVEEANRSPISSMTGFPWWILGLVAGLIILALLLTSFLGETPDDDVFVRDPQENPPIVCEYDESGRFICKYDPDL